MVVIELWELVGLSTTVCVYCLHVRIATVAANHATNGLILELI